MYLLRNLALNAVLAIALALLVPRRRLDSEMRRVVR